MLSYLDFACSMERMKRHPDPYPREPMSERPQPLTEPGVKHPQQFQEEDEEDAVRRWLAHVEAGRIGERA